MKRLEVLLLFVSLPCMAQEGVKPGFVGHRDCRAYFLSDSFVYHRLPDPPLATLARMTDAEKEQWRNHSVIHSEFDGLTRDEEKWWAKKEYKKYPGLCYVPRGYLNAPHPAFDGPLFAVHFTEADSSQVEMQVVTENRSQDVPIQGTANVYDQNGQLAGLATVEGTATVETTEKYPVEAQIDLDFVDVTVWRIDSSSPEKVFYTSKSRRRGDTGMPGMIEAFRRSPRENARKDCLNFLLAETGLEEKEKH